MSAAHDMGILADKLNIQVGHVSTAQAHPKALEALGWQLTRMGRQLLDEAARRRGGTRPGPSRAEQDADGLSWDGTRDPDLTYRGV